MRLRANSTIRKTFASMNVQTTTAPVNNNMQARNHARPALVATGGWSTTDWLLIGALIVAMFFLEGRGAK